MSNYKQISSTTELLSKSDISHNIDNVEDRISCIDLQATDVKDAADEPLYFNATVAILVLSGTAHITINYRNYALNSGSLVVLSAAHLIAVDTCSADFVCRCLFVGHRFMEQMDSTDMINRRIKYGARLFANPLLTLSAADAELVGAQMREIARAIGDTAHLYRNEKILNTLFGFYLDLSNIVEQDISVHAPSNMSRQESIVADFVTLLTTSYRTHHNMDFYASQLNLSTHYLTRVVQRITGRTPSEFIFDMLYSDARIQLTHSRLSIQQITAILSFSDQSAFCKFFRRRAGISPLDFRRRA